MFTAPQPATGPLSFAPPRGNDSQAASAPRATGRFRLVDDFEAGHIKFQGREPRTLEELAIARADSEHRHRLAEVKAMRAKLALLEQFLPALAERGIKLADRKLSLWHGGKVLRIESRASTSSDNKLHAALIELGFREISRKHLWRDEYTVTLQHGRWLAVSFLVTEASKEGGAA